MDWERIFVLILDTGVDMIRSGGETHRVVDTLYRLAGSYGFQCINYWVVPSNIQATLQTPDGRYLTQTRNIRTTGIDFERLEQLNALSRWACAEKPDADALEQRLLQIRSLPPRKVWMHYLAYGMAGWGFSLFFGCEFLESLVGLTAALLIAFFVRLLAAHEGNPLILNFLVSFVTETFIILAVHLGLGTHMGLITIGVVMLVISGLGTTNGLRDLVHLDTLSGVMNITAAFIGAIGISLGIALPLYLFRGWVDPAVVNPGATAAAQLIAGTFACVGFAFSFNVKGKKSFFCALGTFLTTGVYLLAAEFIQDLFVCTLIASICCGLYAQIMARVNKTPATIFSTICILTLIPGSSLYYAMHGIVTKNLPFALQKAEELGLTCFGIVLGYMVVEVLNRFLWKRPHH